MEIRASLKNKPPFLLVVLLAAHLLVVFLNPAPGRMGRTLGAQILMTIFQPVWSLLATTGSGLGGIKEKYLSLRDAREENQKLREEVTRLGSERAQLLDQIKVIDATSQINTWKFDNLTQTIPARVIARDATTWYRTVTIDKGFASGIEKDQPVVAEQGLVGRVVTVAPNASRVLLLTDERHAAGAAIGQTADSRVLGIVQGTSNSYGKNNFRCELKIVGGTSERPQVGEWVMTSGQDGFYPKGIAIGKVVAPMNAAESSPDLVPIQPVAPLNKLDVVGVVLISKEKLQAQVEELNRVEREKEQEDQEKEKRKKQPDPQKKKPTE